MLQNLWGYVNKLQKCQYYIFIYNEIDEIDKLMLYGTLDKNDEISKDLKYQS